jgi:23S rRNA (pseudouridine1915-N3)-methyltransferase
MRLRVIAVGTRVADWVDAGFADYARRLRGPLAVELKQLPAARRSAATPVARAMTEEAQRILAVLAPRDYVVALDERGREYSTPELARWLEERRRSGQDLACVIGGADGLAAAVLARAQERWSLSRLTLPHGLVRVLLIEQLYRAATLLSGHPYHRAS